MARGNLLGFDTDNEQAIGKFIEEFRGGEEFPGVAFVRGTRAAGIGAAEFAEGHAMDGAWRRAGFHGIDNDESFAAAEATEQRKALRAAIHELNLALPALGRAGKVVQKGGADTVIAEKGVAEAENKYWGRVAEKIKITTHHYGCPPADRICSLK